MYTDNYESREIYMRIKNARRANDLQHTFNAERYSDMKSESKLGTSSMSTSGIQPRDSGDKRSSANDSTQMNYNEVATMGNGSKQGKYSRKFYRKRRQQRLTYFLILLLLTGNLLIIYLMMFFYDGYFVLGNNIAMLISLYNLSALFIKLCIFDKASKNEDKVLYVWWLCCLRIGKEPEDRARPRKPPKRIERWSTKQLIRQSSDLKRLS